MWSPVIGGRKWGVLALRNKMQLTLEEVGLDVSWSCEQGQKWYLGTQKRMVRLMRLPPIGEGCLSMVQPNNDLSHLWREIAKVTCFANEPTLPISEQNNKSRIRVLHII